MSDVDRSHLPIRRPPFSGTAGKTLDGSQPDWNLIGHPVPPDGRSQRAARPDRRRRVWESEHLRRTDPDAQPDPCGGSRSSLQPFSCDRAVLSNPCLIADRTEQSFGGFRLDRRVRRRLPGVLGDAAARLRAASPHP